MKKRMMFLALMLIAALGMQAQSLNGTWKTTLNDDEIDMDFYLTFAQKALTMKAIIREFDPEVGHITLSVEIPGTYTCTGNTLKMKTDIKQAKVKIDKLDFVAEIADVLRGSPELKKKVSDELQKEFEKSKEELVSDLPQNSELKIESQTASKLTVRDESGELMVFTKER